METDAILANFTEVADGKLYVVGGGVHICVVNPEPPHTVTIGLGLVVHVPYQLTNQAHQLAVTLLDEDGHIVTPWTPEGAPVPVPVQVTMPFNVGRPTILSPGDEQSLPLAINFTNLPLPQPGRYILTVEIDQAEVARETFRAMVRPQGGAAFGIGGSPVSG